MGITERGVELVSGEDGLNETVCEKHQNNFSMTHTHSGRRSNCREPTLAVDGQ